MKKKDLDLLPSFLSLDGNQWQSHQNQKHLLSTKKLVKVGKSKSNNVKKLTWLELVTKSNASFCRWNVFQEVQGPVNLKCDKDLLVLFQV